MKRFLDHIDLRVKDRTRAEPFYRQLLPALGLTVERSDSHWCTFYEPGAGAVSFFGFTEDRQHQPNETRIAFWAESRAEVDRLAELVRQAGAQNIDGPALEPDYSPPGGYYALFFDDPSGNRLEICCRESKPA